LQADPLIVLLLAAKLGLYASSLIGAGLGLHAALGIVEQDARRSVMQTAAGAAAAASAFAAARLLIVNAQLGGGIAEAFNGETIGWTWQALGVATIVLIAGTLGLAIAWVLRNAWIAAIGSIGMAASFALTGHSQAIETPGLVPWAAGLHVLIAAFWVVAPFTLWPRPTTPEAILAARLQRFSSLAIWVIPALFLLGIWLAWRLAGGIPALFSQTYGQLLVAKFFAVLIALGMGALNKLKLTRTIANGHAGGRGALKQTLLVELTVFAVALILVGLASTVTGPPEMS
jgi:putative copper resistance protein D